MQGERKDRRRERGCLFIPGGRINEPRSRRMANNSLCVLIRGACLSRMWTGDRRAVDFTGDTGQRLRLGCAPKSRQQVPNGSGARRAYRPREQLSAPIGAFPVELQAAC